MVEPEVIVVHLGELDHFEITGVKILRALKASKESKIVIFIPEREVTPVISRGDLKEGI